MRDGREIGVVTSARKGDRHGHLDSAFAEPGTPIETDVRGKPVAARIVPLPFYQRAKP
jgi:aminomethyltransferase